MLDNGNSVTARIFSDGELGGRRMVVSAGTTIYEPGTPPENVYYIVRGQVRLYKPGPGGSSRLIDILGAEEWFGIGALAGAGEYGSRALALVDTVLVEARAASLLGRLSGQPQFLAELNRQLAAKLQAAYDDAARLVFEDCNQRLIGALVRFSRSAASTQREDGVVLRITHDQLAQAVGVARETVSLALTQLRHQNLLRTGRNQLVFNPDALQQFARRQNEPRQNGNGAGDHTQQVQQVA